MGQKVSVLWSVSLVQFSQSQCSPWLWLGVGVRGSQWPDVCFQFSCLTGKSTVVCIYWVFKQVVCVKPPTHPPPSLWLSLCDTLSHCLSVCQSLNQFFYAPFSTPTPHPPQLPIISLSLSPSLPLHNKHTRTHVSLFLFKSENWDCIWLLLGIGCTVIVINSLNETSDYRWRNIED